MPNVIIRAAVIGDVENIKSCFNLPQVDDEKLWLSIDNELCFVGEINNEIVGFLLVGQYSQSWFIDGLYGVEHKQQKNVIDGLLSYIKMLAEVKNVVSINVIAFKQDGDKMGKDYKIMPVENLSAQFLSLWHNDNEKFDPSLRVCMQLKIDIEG